MTGLERALWSVRYVIVVPVVVVPLAAIGVIITTTVDALHIAREVVRSLAAGGTAPAERVQPFGTILRLLEGYLLAAILIIFAVGLYELFIARIGAGDRSEGVPSALAIRSIEDLKARLGRVVLLGLVVEFFQQSFRLGYGSALELLYLAAGIVLVGAALYLSAPKSAH